MNKQIRGRIADILQKKIYTGIISWEAGRIRSIKITDGEPWNEDNLPFIIPGFIDAHVHIESSMLIPSQFARLAVVHGTVATVSDPHEIANVCGMAGVQYMIEDGKKVPFKFYFGAPSCVPATIFETAGAELNAGDVSKLLEMDEIKYLSEMMNFPGVLHKDPEVMAKIAAAHKLHKPVDGHAPGLTGELVQQYIDAGISTDHECFTKEEALGKLKHGMHILIREGSAAKNFEALVDLLNDHSERMMFCSDDKHPDSLVEGHIDQLCARAVAKGIDIFNVLRAACINPVLHYKLETGFLREGDDADFIVVEDLVNFKVLQTYIRGELVAENGKTLIGLPDSDVKRRINNFSCNKKVPADFAVTDKAGSHSLIMEALNGQLITSKLQIQAPAAIDIDNDILKIVVVNRYANAPAAIAFIKNFGLKQGAIASSVAHDSHNIVAVGTSDESICEAVNMIVEKKGGVSLYSPGQHIILPLPVAGLMSDEDGYEIAEKYSTIDKAAKSLGSTLSSPFMTLSFMALLVIPHLKLSDKGLFDGDEFGFV
ncbi:MAG: adenine deaminase [Agriterribacter sp.]